MRSKSTWMVGLRASMPVCCENEAPNTIRRSDSFMNQLATGVPLRPSTPPPSGWRSLIRPLPLKVVMTGQFSASASAVTSAMAVAGHRIPR